MLSCPFEYIPLNHLLHQFLQVKLAIGVICGESAVVGLGDMGGVGWRQGLSILSILPLLVFDRVNRATRDD